MDVRPNTIGYLISCDQNEEDFVDTSLQNLVKNGHESKLPFLDLDKLEELESELGVEETKINTVKLPTTDYRGRPAASRFVNEMFLAGRYKDVQIPRDRLVVRTNKRTLMKIIDFAKKQGYCDLHLKAKLMKSEDGKWNELLLLHYFGRPKSTTTQISGSGQHGEPKPSTSFSQQHNDVDQFPQKFYRYLLENDDNDTEEEVEESFSLFAIHTLQIGNICFIYESHVNAVQEKPESTKDSPLYSLINFKLNSNKEEIKDTFMKYKRLRSYRDRVAEGYYRKIRKFSTQILHGELGSAEKFIFGFKRNGRVTSEELPCFPGKLLAYEVENLQNFVYLLNNSYASDVATLHAFQYWTVSMNRNSMTLSKSGDEIILGSLNLNWR